MKSYHFYMVFLGIVYKIKLKYSKELLDYCWFSRDVTKLQTKKLSILPRFYFHDALEQLKLIFIQIFASKGFFVL